MKENQIFISYSRSDSAFVIKLEEDLARAGIFIWLDQKKISGGKLWDRAIEEALESSGILIIVVSQKSALSENVANEVQFAIDEGKTIIPILIEQTKIPLTWRRYQRIDFIEDYEAGLNNIAQTIKNEMSQMIKSEEEAGVKAKAEEEQRIKDEAEAEKQIKSDTRRIEDEKAKEEFLLKENENAKAEEEKQKQEEAEAEAKAEEEKRIKDEVEVKQKVEEEKRIIRQAESTNKEEEIVEGSAKNTETYNPKKTKYKIPLIVTGVIALLVIIMWVVNSGKNNEIYPIELDQTISIQDDNSEEIAWKEAVSLNTIDSYQGYLDSHLTGAHVAEAKQKIAEFDNLALQENKPQRIAKPVVNIEETAEKIVENVLKAESVSHVEYQNGDFKGAFNQIGQLKWQERNSDGVFSFNEKSRDEWSIYLLDPDRSITIQIDLYNKQILYEGALIYNISNYSNKAN